jgi:hypothetical protein
MALSAKVKVAIVRGLKGLAAVGLAFLAKYIASPDVLNLVGSGNSWIVTALAIPAILAVEKYFNLAPTTKIVKSA